MTTFNIPTTPLTVGQHIFGPFTYSAGGSAQLVIDRTVTGGLNSLTAASTVLIDVEVSNDGGASWTLLVGTQLVGGIYTNRQGTTATQDTLGANNIMPGTQARSVVTVAGPSSVAIAGALTLS